jgi:anti-sigma B factor antagonist
VELILSTERRGTSAVVAVDGEIDLGTAGQLRDHLAECIRDETRDIVLDLSAVTFMDSTGLQVLIATQRRLEPLGGRLRLVGLRSGVAKVLKVTGLDQTFPAYESVDAAIADA